MDTRLLRIFSAVARHGSLPLASRELHLTASALSHALKSLESQLGARLFDRIGKRLILNHAGEQLLSQITVPLAALDQAAAAIKDLGKWGQSRLRIGAPDSICQQILPTVIQGLRRGFAELMVVLECGETTELLEMLHQDRLDIVLGVEPDPVPQIETFPWFQDELLFAFSSRHAWSDGRSLALQEIARQPMISYRHKSITSRSVQKYFAAQQIELRLSMEADSVPVITRLVMLNLGVAVLAPWVFGSELARGLVKMRPLGLRTFRRQWCFIHTAGKRLSLVEVEFLKLCRRQPPGLRLDRKDLPEAARVLSNG